MFERAPLRTTVAAQAIVVQTPACGERPGVLQRRQDFAREAIVADSSHGPFDPSFREGVYGPDFPQMEPTDQLDTAKSKTSREPPEAVLNGNSSFGHPQIS